MTNHISGVVSVTSGHPVDTSLLSTTDDIHICTRHKNHTNKISLCHNLGGMSTCPERGRMENSDWRVRLK